MLWGVAVNDSMYVVWVYFYFEVYFCFWDALLFWSSKPDVEVSNSSERENSRSRAESQSEGEQDSLLQLVQGAPGKKLSFVLYTFSV